MTLKVFEGFAGYGGASFSLKALGIEHELVGYSEIDKYAIKCFEQNHGGTNFGDIKDIRPEDLPDFDLFTGGFPCQAFSNAGKMLGELDPRGTLFYEIIRICEIKQPKYILLENVKGLTSKKFAETFSKILSELDRIGYNVTWSVLNSKDYGIPQSRSRVWFVCIRKDIEQTFEFPQKEPLTIFIKDILEKDIDKKYYLSEKLQERFKNYVEQKNIKVGISEPAILDLYNKNVKDDGTSITLTDPCHNTLRLIEGDNTLYDIRSKTELREYEGVSHTLKTRMGTGGNNTPITIAPTLTTELSHQVGNTFNEKTFYNMTGQLRRLTPKECFRLMGFFKDEINLEGLSDTQQYKLAGNGWCLRPAQDILRNLLKE